MTASAIPKVLSMTLALWIADSAAGSAPVTHVRLGDMILNIRAR